MIEDALNGGGGVSMSDGGPANASSSNNAEDKWLRKHFEYSWFNWSICI